MQNESYIDVLTKDVKPKQEDKKDMVDRKLASLEIYRVLHLQEILLYALVFVPFLCLASGSVSIYFGGVIALLVSVYSAIQLKKVRPLKLDYEAKYGFNVNSLRR